MKLAIMQPYFLPYIGYFQLIASVDNFIIYDNIKYTKRGWINRNRMLLNGSDATFSLPLKKGSDSLNVVDRELSADFNRAKLLNQFRGAYGRAPQFDQSYPLLERIVRYEDANLFRYIYNSVIQLCQHLGIHPEIRVSSEIAIDHELKGQDKVLALCKFTGASTYINTTGGLELYSREMFDAAGVELNFIKTKPIQYPQFQNFFVMNLSIIDVLMFNPLDQVRKWIYLDHELI